MAKRSKPEEIIAKLREVEVQLSDHLLKMISEAESLDVLKEIWMSLSESEQKAYKQAVNDAKVKLSGEKE